MKRIYLAMAINVKEVNMYIYSLPTLRFLKGWEGDGFFIFFILFLLC